MVASKNCTFSYERIKCYMNMQRTQFITFCFSNFIIILICCLIFKTKAIFSSTFLARDLHKEKLLNFKELKYYSELFDEQKFVQLLTPLMRRRVSGTEENKAVREYIITNLENEGWYVETDNFVAKTPYGVRSFSNIIATANPLVPRRLILACHYDSKYFHTNSKFIGATDSAVPCALLLDLGSKLLPKLLETSRQNQNITLQLVFFDGEEAFKNWNKRDSLYGSRHLAQKWENENRLKQIDLLVLLDLLGSYNSIIPNFSHNEQYWFNQIHSAQENLLNLGAVTKQHLSSSSSWQSIDDDHQPFMQKGVPVLHIIPTPFPAVWHTELDNWEALDFDSIAELSKLFYVFTAMYLHL